jgi:hypothetical protein
MILQKFLESIKGKIFPEEKILKEGVILGIFGSSPLKGHDPLRAKIDGGQ